MENILITGGSGLVGRQLIPKLQNLGYNVAILSRTQQKDVHSFVWDLNKKYIDPKAIEWCDHIIHLAGAGIADKRWSASRKKEIIDSRVDGIDIIISEIEKQQKMLKTFVSASGIGYFSKHSVDDSYDENSPYGTDFPSQVCVLWEKKAQEMKKHSERLAIIRTGIVLAKNGGALSKLIPIFKLGFGSAIGSGKQYMPWIHINDLVNIFASAITNIKIKGTYNATADNPVTNKEFGRILAKVLKRTYFLPNVPSFILKLVLGEMATIVLTGGKVDNTKIKTIIGDLSFENLEDALRDLVGK